MFRCDHGLSGSIGARLHQFASVGSYLVAHVRSEATKRSGRTEFARARSELLTAIAVLDSLVRREENASIRWSLELDLRRAQERLASCCNGRR